MKDNNHSLSHPIIKMNKYISTFRTELLNLLDVEIPKLTSHLLSDSREVNVEFVLDAQIDVQNIMEEEEDDSQREDEAEHILSDPDSDASDDRIFSNSCESDDDDLLSDNETDDDAHGKEEKLTSIDIETTLQAYATSS